MFIDLIEIPMMVTSGTHTHTHTHTYTHTHTHIYIHENEGAIDQSCPTLQPMAWSPPGLLCPRNSLGKNTGVGCHSLLQGIFPAEGLNLGLLHCRWILHHLNHRGSPCIYYMYLHMDYINIYSFLIYICAYVYIFDTYVNTLYKAML